MIVKMGGSKPQFSFYSQSTKSNTVFRDNRIQFFISELKKIFKVMIHGATFSAMLLGNCQVRKRAAHLDLGDRKSCPVLIKVFQVEI